MVNAKMNRASTMNALMVLDWTERSLGSAGFAELVLGFASKMAERV